MTEATTTLTRAEGVKAATLSFFISPGYYEQPFVAKLVGGIAKFYLAHWQWVIGTIIAMIGIIVAL